MDKRSASTTKAQHPTETNSGKTTKSIHPKTPDPHNPDTLNGTTPRFRPVDALTLIHPTQADTFDVDSPIWLAADVLLHHSHTNSPDFEIA
ncbi:hypothetical protein [Acidihalobacter ferrooxydans]|uniref:hypothetical protein n=1 Tax=Acidihalobacter ferrooxydans TaxID=1765967 RepID=UPI0012EB7AD4|nr:hypothetical protein [Acidihalobacter ferrooxydans]